MHWVAMLRSVVVSGRKCKMPTHWYQTYWPRSVMWMPICEWIDQHLPFLILIEAEIKWLPFSRQQFIPRGPMNNWPTLVQLMAWCWIADKPLSEPVIGLFTDAYINGLVQDCSNSIANTLELLQSCTKSSMYVMWPRWVDGSLQNSLDRGPTPITNMD